MSYQATGGVTDTLIKIAPAVQAVSHVAVDPALPQVVCHVMRLKAITNRQNPGSPCPPLALSAQQKTQGVGLYVIEPPLRAFVWARENPAVAVAVVAGVVGLIGFVGYSIGKGRRAL